MSNREVAKLWRSQYIPLLWFVATGDSLAFRTTSNHVEGRPVLFRGRALSTDMRVMKSRRAHSILF
jgi:hypothetical protein